jgi:hypothetical protein
MKEREEDLVRIEKKTKKEGKGTYTQRREEE